MLTFLCALENEKIRSHLEQAYYLYHKELIHKANDILKDKHEAEDIVQSAFIKFSSYIDENIDIKGNKTRVFIVIIVRGLAINLYNQRKRRTNINFDELKDVIESKEDTMPEFCVLRLDKSTWIAEELAKLKVEYADILTLKYVYGYTNKEIAGICDITEGNVRTRLNRARKALHNIIGVGGYEQTDK